MRQAALTRDLNAQLLEVTKNVERANSQSEKLRQTWELIPKLAKASQSGISGWALGLTSYGRNLQKMGESFGRAMQQGYVDTKKLAEEIRDIQRELRAMGTEQIKLAALSQSSNSAEAADARKKLSDLTEYAKLRRVEQAELKENLKNTAAHNRVIEAYNHLSLKRAAITTLIASTGLQTAIKHYGEFNQALIESNVQENIRNKLVKNIYAVQAATGNSTADMARAAKALVAYGFDLKGNFRDTLQTVVMLEEGLGVSETHAAELANIFENRLHMSVRGVATLISQVVDDTALAADQAVQFASQIGRAFASLRPGGISSAATRDMTDFLLRLEGASQQVLGTTGEVTSLFKRMMTSTEGMQASAFLGIYNPEQISVRGPQRFLAGLEGISRQIEGLGRNERIVASEQFARILGISSEYIQNLPDLISKLNESRKSELDIEERWRSQVAQASPAFIRLKNSFMALVHEGLIPVVKGVSALTELLNKVVGWVASSKVASAAFSTVVIGGVVVATGLAIRELALLTKTLWLLAGAARVARISTAAGSGLSGIGSFLGIGGTASGGLLGLGAVAAGAAIGIGLGHLFNRYVVAPVEEIYNSSEALNKQFRHGAVDLMTLRMETKALTLGLNDYSKYVDRQRKMMLGTDGKVGMGMSTGEILRFDRRAAEAAETRRAHEFAMAQLGIVQPAAFLQQLPDFERVIEEFHERHKEDAKNEKAKADAEERRDREEKERWDREQLLNFNRMTREAAKGF